jgi:multidrug resistance efflux pump
MTGAGARLTACAGRSDSDTLRVEGYFEETKLPRIHLGDPVNVRLLGSDHRCDPASPRKRGEAT